jgi:hypothetical protein
MIGDFDLGSTRARRPKTGRARPGTASLYDRIMHGHGHSPKDQLLQQL